MNESTLCTIAQIAQFPTASAEVALTAHGGGVERYAHIGRVLKRLLGHFSLSVRDAVAKGELWPLRNPASDE